MHRRQFIGAAASSGLAAAPVSAAQQKAVFELRYYRMRNGSQTQRTSDFLSKHFLPAAERLGIGVRRVRRAEEEALAALSFDADMLGVHQAA